MGATHGLLRRRSECRQVLLLSPWVAIVDRFSPTRIRFSSMLLAMNMNLVVYFLTFLLLPVDIDGRTPSNRPTFGGEENPKEPGLRFQICSTDAAQTHRRKKVQQKGGDGGHAMGMRSIRPRRHAG